MNDTDKWWSGCRMGMLDIHTNNLVESWHNILKSRYLKGARKQRPDMLVHILLDEAIESIKLKVLLALNGFQTRRTNLAEQNQIEKSHSIPSEIAMALISHSYASEESDESGEEIFVKSFTKENIKYKISLNDEGLVSSCTYGFDQEMFAADFRQVIKLIEPVINDYDKLEDQDQYLCQEVLDTLRAMSTIRHRISRQNWSEKQRR
ncbi:hypothetical protein GcM3_066028 [Golovinomyces cichoracearum]|uniref:Uncharacterized protein n=1 Tax=Golovinomyces cichoracearum TaxID=62708 RepID=A0A420IUH1_9PEZI|nr:hypothetical protein GcM3_066028 [Golovinomyces cichoracearum]